MTRVPTNLRQAVSDPDTIIIRRRRGASALMACLGLPVAGLFLIFGAQTMTQATPEALVGMLGIVSGVLTLLMSIGLLLLAGLDIPIAIVSHAGIILGGLNLLFGTWPLIAWADIEDIGVSRLRQRTMLLIHIRSASHWRTDPVTWWRPYESLWRLDVSPKGGGLRISDRWAVLRSPEIMALIGRRFSEDLHRHNVKLINT